MALPGCRAFALPVRRLLLICAALLPPLCGMDFPAAMAAGARDAVQIPRSDAPMNEMTAFYERHKARVVRNGAGRLYTYFLLPPHGQLTPGALYPLVVILHDGTGLAQAGRYILSPLVRESHPAFALVPMLRSGAAWGAPGRDPADPRYGLADTMEIVSMLVRSRPVDPKRVYVIGCAEGGTGVFGAVRHYPSVFAAGVSLGGEWDPLDAKAMTGVPLLVMGNDAEGAPPALAHDMADMIGSYGGAAAYSGVPAAEWNCAADPLYTPEMWDWMFSRSRK